MGRMRKTPPKSDKVMQDNQPPPKEPDSMLTVLFKVGHRLAAARLIEAFRNPETETDLGRAVARMRQQFQVGDGEKSHYEGFISAFSALFDALRAIDDSIPPGLPPHLLDPAWIAKAFRLRLEDFNWQGPPKRVCRPGIEQISSRSGAGVYTSVSGNNADLLAAAAAVHFKPGWRIADVTYGQGVFWRQIDLSQYDLHASDLLTCPKAPYDFRHLPYTDASFDVAVLDPPYAHNPGKMLGNANYLNRETTKGFCHKDIIRLYEEGMVELRRILKPGGLLLIKCQDEIESGKQKMSHYEILDVAKRLGLKVKDLFVLTPTAKPPIQHFPQKHARKNHSYLLVFQKAK